MARSIKEIDAEIKVLEKEREIIRYQELAKKYSSILDLLEESKLSVAKIRKIFITATTSEPSVTMITASSEGEKTIVTEPKKNDKEKTEKKPRKPRSKPNFKEKPCEVCGKLFVPKSGRNKVCDECKAQGKVPQK